MGLTKRIKRDTWGGSISPPLCVFYTPFFVLNGFGLYLSECLLLNAFAS